jgi:hypothetical protein
LEVHTHVVGSWSWEGRNPGGSGSIDNSSHLDSLASHQVEGTGLKESVAELSKLLIEIIDLGDEDGNCCDANVVELPDDGSYPGGQVGPSGIMLHRDSGKEVLHLVRATVRSTSRCGSHHVDAKGSMRTEHGRRRWFLFAEELRCVARLDGVRKRNGLIQLKGRILDIFSDVEEIFTTKGGRFDW